MSKTLYAIDGHAAIYRAYYAIRSKMSAPDTGMPVHAVFGFTQILHATIDRFSPDYLVVAMDSKGPTFRHERYPEYKATRKKMPEDLVPQIGQVERVCEAYEIPVLKKQGFEADDLLGTVAAKAVEMGIEVVIVSGDKDVLQLVDDARGVRVWDPIKELTLREKEVEQSRGVPPGRMTELLGLQGDSSDNIPGVPGVGPKTAVQLLKKYGSLEDVLANADKEKGKRRENLENFADQARLSQELATIRMDAPVQVDFDAARLTSGDSEKLIGVFRELGFRKFLTSIKEKGPGASGAKYHRVTTRGELRTLAKTLNSLNTFAIDTETDSVHPRTAKLVGMSFSWKTGEGWYVPVRARAGEKTLDQSFVVETMRGVLENGKISKVGQNIKFDMQVLRGAGIELRGVVFDTMIAAYLLRPDGAGYDLASLSLQYLGRRKTMRSEVIGSGAKSIRMDEAPLDIVSDYAAEDADVTWQLYEVLGKKLRDSGLEELHRNIEMPLVPVLADMEWAGIRVDVGLLKSMSQDLAELLEVKRSEVVAAAGEEFNMDSPAQVRKLLFDKFKLPVIRKTRKTGVASTDWLVLEALADKHPLPALILEYRKLAKIKSTYADALPEQVSSRTGRIHTSFRQTGTATGRLSSSDPNLQNIPIRSDVGKSIRRCFVASDENHILLSADYSQIELRVLAHISGDERLVTAFRRGLDIHARVASEVFEVPLKKVTPEQRRAAKAVNFGIIYGQGPKGLAQALGTKESQAKKFIDRYFKRFEGVARCREEITKKARAEHRVSTLLGRLRFLPEIDSDLPPARSAAERAAINTVFQGSAADIIKKAMVDIHHELVENPDRYRSDLVLQIHDELLLDVERSRLDQTRDMVVRNMEHAYKLRVPLTVDVGTGDNWLDVK